ncbi:MAG: ribonuclease HI [Clostridia bacterium]|nr:ribonuclease HI [Clostridia bacterium]MDD4375956.1 ribonuclease HI [Clostridia bacterium]
MKKVIIYTDGACSGNPGPGGYAAVLMYDRNIKEISGGEKVTTNNRMELMAAIVALETLKEPCEVELYSDSAYLVNAYMQGWVENWKKNGWKTSDKKEVKNKELWERIEQQRKRHAVMFIKVKGHSDNEHNNRCDELAVIESQKFQK